MNSPIKPGLSPVKPDLSKLEAAITDKLRREVDNAITIAFADLTSAINKAAVNDWGWNGPLPDPYPKGYMTKDALGTCKAAIVNAIVKHRIYDYMTQFIKKVEVLG